MLSVAVGVRDLAGIRFAISPLWEAVASVRILRRPDWFPVYLPWVRQVRPRLSAVDWRLFGDLVPVPTRVIPGFVCPPPLTSQPTLELELAALAATPPEVVRAGLDELPGPRPAQLATLYADPSAGLARLAEVIADYADAAIAPYWPRMRTLLEREVLVGAGRMAAGGVQGLLAEVADELGGPLRDLSRHDKQQAVLLLEARGAFEYRKSAEIVAEALGVTRFTVYNYLNRAR